MGHGTHWQTVTRNANEDLASMFNAGIGGGRVVGRRQSFGWRGPTDAEKTEFTWLLGVVVTGDSLSYLHTAFPVASRGKRHRVRVVRAHESSFGLEARITAELGDAEITFFEPYYALNADRYTPGAELEITLAGIVYAMQIPDPSQTITHPEIDEVHLDGAAILLPVKDSDFDTLPRNGFGLAYIVESSGPGPDDYNFRGPVKAIKSIEFLGLPAKCITATLLRMNEGDVDIDVDLYVLDENIHSRQNLRLGSHLSGVLWLQGFAD